MNNDFIKYYKADSWQNDMNHFGRAAKPFFFIFDFEMSFPVLIPFEELPSLPISFSFPGFTTQDFTSYSPINPAFSKKAVPFEIYKNAFDIVMKNILYGNSYLVNLTFPTRITLDSSLSSLFHCVSAPYKLLIGENFLVFSPELFIRIKNKQIFTFPMKGTIRASVQEAEKKILTDPKEAAEHATIVDLLRDDLSRVSSNVQVEKYRYIDKIKTNQEDLLQVSSIIKGTLPENYRNGLGDIFKSILPAGSVSGAPKVKTLKIIREAEGSPRGYYTGVFGYFDGINLESAVIIRCIEKMNNTYWFKSGGGITHLSKAEDEYQELIDKVYVPID
jgi:para-aminobenzoate synthetase component I